ncbi:MAG: DUF3095 domain-containing protein [Xanthomonadaceae bacterium]|nr:DUF3095 domain-containing protein [Xanthomonadaceae bacterium]
MNDDGFYASLEPVERFEGLTDPACYRPLPDDWHVAVADISGSTRAIADGRYKAVNTVGVSVIAAITNALRPLDLPYLFGGDGAVVCVPDHGAAAARRALAGTAAMSRKAFGLELRAALVPAAWLRERGQEVLVARHRVSQHYDQCAVQCALHGGGAPLAEALLKSGGLPVEFRVEADPTIDADYSGLECRWREIPSPADETIAVIVQVGDDANNPLDIYRAVMRRIEEIYGDGDTCRPVAERGMQVTLSSFALGHEASVRTWRATRLQRLRYAAIQRLQVMLGWVLFATGAKTEDTDWARYKGDAVANTDFRKFDGCLRLVLAGTPAQRESLAEFLEGLRATGAATYGIHVSDAAIMTCLVRQRQHEHVHFVDAAGGGYAAAAKHMKAQW